MGTQWIAGEHRFETTATGRAVLADPRLNRGTAFTPEERATLGLVGLVPPQSLTQDQQAVRAYAQYRSQPTDLAKNVYLTGLHDRNEVLFYRLVGDHLGEMLPIVYTPTVGTAIERYSYEFRRPHGIYLSVNAPEEIEEALRGSGLGAGDVDLIVATDGEAILGIGDWGVGGIDISEGKLAVYTAAGGVDPNRTLAVMLDVGTNRQQLLEDPLYLGNRHPRVDEKAYDAFIDAYVTTANRLFPDALLHWEDFGTANARRILDHYRDRVFTFNDDVQGTGAVNLAAVLSATKASGMAMTDHRIVVFGAGSAGTGIADQFRDALVADGLAEEEADRRFWAVDRYGLLTDDQDGLRDAQIRYARPAAEVVELGTGRAARRCRARRGGPSGPADGADRHLRSGRRLHRAGRTGDGRPHPAAGHPADVQSDATGRGHPRRPAEMDRRTGAGGHRQPLRTGRVPGRDVSDRPGEQRADLPRAGPGRDPRPRHPCHRRHARRRRPRGGRTGRREYAGRARPPAARRAARDLRRGGGSGRPRRGPRRRRPHGGRRRLRQAGAGRHVAAGLPGDQSHPRHGGS